jgi:glycosyltransferase involved in cell wall biosynthesis
MKRVLVVSPYFPPANGADSHRVRVTLPFFFENGWEAEVLAVEPDCVAVPRDPWLLRGVPEYLKIHRVKAISLRWSRIPGLGTVDFRAFRAIGMMGANVLREGKFDLVYFSTTVFPVLVHGAKWKQQFGVPYVIDYQDPWCTDYYRHHPGVRPPGGRLKYSIVEWIARRQEPKALRDCSGITAVSPAYLVELAERYEFAVEMPHLVVPFPGARRDFERIESESINQDVYDPGDGLIHWVYVGVSGPIMYKTLGAFFKAIADQKAADPAWAARLRMHFIGTSYAPAGQGIEVVVPLAKQYGLQDNVIEQTDRVPYSIAIRCLLDADALIAPGSDDSAYNASKLLPYLMARKPLLAMFHKDSPAAELLGRVGGATIVAFESEQSEDQIADQIHDKWLRSSSFQQVLPMNQQSAEVYTDSGQARLLCEFFDVVLGRTSRVKS